MAKTSRLDQGVVPKQRLRKGEGYDEKRELYYSYYRDKDGVRRKVTSKDLEAMREKKREAENFAIQRVSPRSQKKTLDSVYDEWIATKVGLGEHTRSGYEWVYDHYCKGTKLGKMNIQDITQSIIVAHYSKLKEQKKLKVSTIDSLQNVIRQTLKYAVGERYILQNPADGAMTDMKRTAETRQAHKALTKAEQDRFFSFIENHEIYSHWEPMFKVFAGTGMRVAELAGLRWQDIDLEEKTISVDHNLLYFSKKEDGGCHFSVSRPKTKAGTRTIVMIDAVREAFIRQKEYIQSSGLTCKVKVEGVGVPEKVYTDFIFINKDGRPFHQNILNKAIKRIIRDANCEAMDNPALVKLPKFSCHTFRSTYITRAAEKNVPIEITMKQVGHADKKTTMQIYTTVHPDWQGRELTAMEDFFE